MKLPTYTMMKRVIDTTEEAINTEGWHQDPVMFLIDNRVDKIYARGFELPLPRKRLASYLYRMALDLNRDDGSEHTQQALTEMIDGGCCGVMICHEIMSNTAMTPDEQMNEDRDLWDIPGSKETRVVHGLDLNGRVYQAMRVRGEKPYDFTKVKEFHQHGLIPSAMQMFLMGIARNMPDGLEHVEALSKVEILTLEQVHTKVRENSGRGGVRFLKEG